MAGGTLVSAATRLGLLRGLDVTRVYQVIGRRYANRELLHFQQPLGYAGHSGLSLTGEQIRDLGFRIAGALAAAGLSDNDRVVVAKANHPDYVLHIYSTIAAGGIPVSVNSGAGWAYIRRIAARTSARYLITDAATLPGSADEVAVAQVRDLLEAGVTLLVVGPGAEAAAGRWSALGSARDFAAEIGNAAATPPPPRRTAPDTVVAMFHTSGTTGVPKCCVWTRRNAERIWKIMLLTLPVSPRTRAMNAAPCSHALFFAIQTAGLLSGAPTYVISKFDPQEFLRTIEQRRITHVIAFPYVYMRVTAENMDEYDLSSMRLWATGADKAHAAHIARLIRFGGLRLRPGGRKGSVFVDSYGSTEIGAGGIMQLWTPGSRPVPCKQGKPMPTQFGMRIVDERWHDLPRGSEGRILVRSTTHFDGYWNDHDTWAHFRHGGWWWGGDVGLVGPRGHLFFLDREADSVRTEAGVIRTLPVEERLLEHAAVMEAAVFERTTDHLAGLGEAVAWVVPRGVLTAADLDKIQDVPRLEADLRAWADEALQAPLRLAEVRLVALESVPLGVTGKILKRQLREQASAQVGAEAEGPGR
jgi:3-aminoavenalumate diazotase